MDITAGGGRRTFIHSECSIRDAFLALPAHMFAEGKIGEGLRAGRVTLPQLPIEWIRCRIVQIFIISTRH
jgi:hypothetical protein